MRVLKRSKTRNKIYVCRFCGDIFISSTNIITNCKHDFVLREKTPIEKSMEDDLLNERNKTAL